MSYAYGWDEESESRLRKKYKEVSMAIKKWRKDKCFVLVTIETDEGAELDEGYPTAAQIAEEIELVMKDRDLDTGWHVIKVEGSSH